MNRILVFLWLTLLNIGFAYSQFDAQFSQYMFHTSSFNPAAVGEGDLIQITGQHRLQWLGMPNAGQTTVFSINSPLKVGKLKQGIGLIFLNDKVGQFTDQEAHIQYAYKKLLGNGVLSIGADLGFLSLGFNGGDSIHKIPIGDYYDFTTDPEIPKTNVAGISFDMNIGVYYSTKTFYTGLSYKHLNNPTVLWGDFSQFKPRSTLFFTGGYHIALANPKYEFIPSTLIKTDFASWQIDLSSRLEYDNRYWGGISYRYQDAIIFLAGVNIAGGLSIGYSFDLPTSQVISVSSGSHEFLVTYCFEYIFGQRGSKFKSIRIL